MNPLQSRTRCARACAGVIAAGLLLSPVAGAEATTVEATAHRPGGATRVAVGDATYRTALTGWVPSLSRTYGFRSGRMVNGRLPRVSRSTPEARVQIKDIDNGRVWKRRSVRFVDVAGNRAKEVVVIMSAHAGGVAWPNNVFVYDARGRLLLNWDSGRYHGDAREAVSFGKATRSSVQVRVDGIPLENEGSCCGTGKARWVLRKGANGKLRMTRTG